MTTTQRFHIVILLLFNISGITGNVKVDSNGDREPDYWVFDLEPGADNFSVVIEARMSSDVDQVSLQLYWIVFIIHENRLR